MDHPHAKARNLLVPDPNQPKPLDPSPAPKLSRTPAILPVRPNPRTGQHTTTILKEFGFSEDKIRKLIQSGAVSFDIITLQLTITGVG
jgi:alpha-methylacyl-CoA racemase